MQLRFYDDDGMESSQRQKVRTMLSTIALFSSSRRRGNTGQLIDRIALELNIEVVDLASQRISSYDYEHLNRADDFESLDSRSAFRPA